MSGYWKGKKLSEETKRKMSLTRKRLFKEQGIAPPNWLRKKRKPFSEEHKRKIGLAGIGRKHTEEWKKRISERVKGNKFALGQKHTKEWKQQNSILHKGRKRSEITRQRLSEAKLGKKNPMYGKKLTKEQIRKFLRRRPMSYLETVTQKVIDKHYLPYKFVGNGAFFIENLNPDFINTNSKKIAVEVYSKRQKDFFRDGGTEAWKYKRIKVFSKYGWSIIFLEQKDMTEQYIFTNLKGG